MMQQLELDMIGGAPTARLRRRRPGIDDLPWGSVDLATYQPDALAEARLVWTNGVFTEYASAAAFGALTGALLECGAPIDLSAAAADIVVDELDHAELVARLVMELGGAVPYHADLERVAPATTPGVAPLLRAAELAITTSCVGEALSLSALGRSRALLAAPGADAPRLVVAVVDRLLADEGPHARLGHWFLTWAADRLTAADRAHLAAVAISAVEVYAPLWRERCAACVAPAPLGGVPVDSYATAMVDAIRQRIARPLARHGIALPADRLAALGA